MNFAYPAGATPLDPDTLAGLLPALTTQAELNEFEERNIVAATLWARRSRLLRREYPNVTALRRLHRQMFDLTWAWAGTFRQVDTNIGVAKQRIPLELHGLCDDVRFWLAHEVYPWDERAAHFHHRLVAIHPFPNGNGRHARLATNILLAQHRQQPFTWGSQSLVADSSLRQEYIAALREADAGNIARLLAFVRT